jgi:hypothetical protein
MGPDKTRKARRHERILNLTAGRINRIWIPRFYDDNGAGPYIFTEDWCGPNCWNPNKLENLIYCDAITLIKKSAVSEEHLYELIEQFLNNVPAHIRIKSSFEELLWSTRLGRVVHRTLDAHTRTTHPVDCIGKWPLAFENLYIEP